MMAQRIFKNYGEKVPAEALNKTVLFVVRRAQKLTPAVSQSTIDSDLLVKVTSKLAVRGKNKGKPLKDGSTDLEMPDMNKAMLIVMARMNPNSPYSLMTGNRWPLPAMRPSDFGRAYGHENAMRMFIDNVLKPMAERMVRARHSSTHFLQASWTAIIRQLLPYVPTNYRGGFDAGIFPKTLLTGEAVPAKAGGPIFFCKISDTLGMNPANEVLGNKYNEALHRKAGAALQEAINLEAVQKLELAAKQGWIDRSAALAMHGFILS